MLKDIVFVKHRLASIVLTAYLVLAILTILFFNGTGDSGDSTLHYLFARYAPQHPALFFDHWAKPLFVLLACPFAQFGITGMKVFNVLAGFVAMLYAYKTAHALNMKHPALAMVFMLFAPLYYILTFSGLTELLFAAMLSVATFLTFKNKLLPALLIVSFLPYVRSEGLLIIGVFGVWLLFARFYRYLPMLAIGSVVYNLVGYPFRQKALWVVSEIPYSKLGSHYGKGPLSHFALELVNVLGVPIYGLLILGLSAGLLLVLRQTKPVGPTLLIVLVFLVFFVSHTLFWYFGIFNSMGLKRVFLAIVPTMALLALEGFNRIEEWLNGFKPGVGSAVGKVLVAYVVVFPFTPNPAAIQWERDMQLSEDQLEALQVAGFLKKNTLESGAYLYAYHYLSEAMNIDHFDKDLHLEYNDGVRKNMRKGQLLVWDRWFMPTEKGVSEQMLNADTTLDVVFRTSAQTKNKPGNFIVYRKK